MSKFKDLKDLMTKIDYNRPNEPGTLLCDLNSVTYLSKLIPEFQLRENWQKAVQEGEGYIGWYQDDDVYLSPHLEDKEILWVRNYDLNTDRIMPKGKEE